MNEEIFSKVRRFLVINAMDGHCICLPIVTYSGQGVNKLGVHADHHAIVYTGRKPVSFKGEREKGLMMRSIKVIPNSPRDSLDPASRLNYAKSYTVEYNVKVCLIGRVAGKDEGQLRTDYNRVHPPLGIRAPPVSNSFEVGSQYYYGYSSASCMSSSSAYPSHDSPVPHGSPNPASLAISRPPSESLDTTDGELSHQDPPQELSSNTRVTSSSAAPLNTVAISNTTVTLSTAVTPSTAPTSIQSSQAAESWSDDLYDA
jgi:hypothetical protein